MITKMVIIYVIILLSLAFLYIARLIILSYYSNKLYKLDMSLKKYFLVYKTFVSNKTMYCIWIRPKTIYNNLLKELELMED